MRNVLLIALIFFSMLAKCDEINDGDIDRYFKKTVAVIRSNDYETLSNMFHYPPSYKGERLQEDLCNVKNDMADLFEYFGMPEELKDIPEFSLYYSFGAGGGDVPYWALHPKSITVAKQVRFSKEGIGVLKVELSFINEKLEIKRIAVGYFASDRHAKEKMKKAISYSAKNQKERDKKGVCAGMKRSANKTNSVDPVVPPL